MRWQKLLAVLFILFLANCSCDEDLFNLGPPPRSFTIQGKVWEDSNGNGQQDQAEEFLPGITVTLMDAELNQLGTTETDENGHYSFENLRNGHYIIQVDAQIGAQFSPKDQGSDATDSDVGSVTGTTDRITLHEQDTPSDVLDFDAGLFIPASADQNGTSTKTFNPIFLGYFAAFYRHLGNTSEVVAQILAMINDPNPLAGAEVTITITHPDGSTDTQTATTDQNGAAELTFPIFVYGAYTLTIDDLTSTIENATYTPDLNLASSMAIQVGASEPPPVAALDRIQAFYDNYNQAFSDQDSSHLFSALHPAVFDLYGEEACRAYLDGSVANPIRVEVLAVTEFGSWSYDRDDRSIPIDNAYAVEVEVTLPDSTTQRQTAHVALRPDASIGWFTDCGEPLP